MAWFVYILLCDQKTFYVGRTQYMEERLLEHQRGYSNFTEKFSNIKLVHKEQYRSFKEAEQRENQLKKWSVAKKKALIAGNKDLLVRLSKSREIADKHDRK